MVAEKDKLLADANEEIERVKVDYVDAEARVVVVYQDGFKDTSEYKDFAHHFMTASGEQLVEKIAESYPEWDISFLRHPPNKVCSTAKPRDMCEAQTLLLTTGEGP
ncbi:hypothetical protein Adt_18597 [Abeliophyllum distichum]|uniref:Uncharacterized protein n=1 Tax=Abeliophyllum distichum TaxID=126358 RepID=A0ABD1TJT6_9LAMI